MRIYNEFLGEVVEIPDYPERIVSLAPDITDILHRIGVWDRVVGVSLYCKRPPAADEKPRLGAYLKVNEQKLREVKPDLILTTTGAQRNTTLSLLKQGYPVYPIKLPFTLYDILDNISRVGAVVREIEGAYRESERLFELLKTLRKKLPPTRVMVEIDLHPEYTIGNASFLNHALDFMGLKNIFADMYASYFRTPYEIAAVRSPELIIYEPKPMRKKKPTVEELTQRYTELGLGNAPAVKGGKILITGGDMIAHYGPAFIDEVMPYITEEVERLMDSKS